jgi:hypothetical protein
MLENEAKGWYGSYSIIGRSIVERFQILLKKDEILSNKIKKIAVRNFFTDEENLTTEKTSNNKKGKKCKKLEIDIFSETFDKKKKEKTKKKYRRKKNKTK